MDNQSINRSSQHFDGFMRVRESSLNDIRSDLSAAVNRSGNSDVDVNVNIQVDTMPIGLSLLCLSFAKKQITREEFESAVKELVKVTNNYKKSDRNRDRESRVKLFNDNKSNRVWGRY